MTISPSFRLVLTREEKFCELWTWPAVYMYKCEEFGAVDLASCVYMYECEE